MIMNEMNSINDVAGSKPFPRLRYCNNFSFGKQPFCCLSKSVKHHKSDKSDKSNKLKSLRNKSKASYKASYDVGIVGIPFDSGCSFRPGARFGPSSVRTVSCILREYNISQKCYPFKKKVIDFGDIFATPFDILDAVDHMEKSLINVLKQSNKYIIIGGDHTLSYPSLKAINSKYGKCSLIHFDSHLDTYDDHFGCKITHGTPFKKSVEDDLLLEHRFHVGLRGGTYSEDDLSRDKNLGFKIYPVDYADKKKCTVTEMMEEIVEQVKGTNVYVSIDIDVVDPAFAPGTGTPEVGGFSSREFLAMIRSLSGLNIVGADVVEISPPYDSNANITALLGASICYELLSIM